MDLLDRAEARRKTSLAGLKPDEQVQFGQYFTPYQAARIIADLASETEAWCTSDPTHMIHLNGERFLRPCEVKP